MAGKDISMKIHIISHVCGPFSKITDRSIKLTIDSLDEQLALNRNLSCQDIADAKKALSQTYPYAHTSTVGKMIVTRAAWCRNTGIFSFILSKKILS